MQDFLVLLWREVFGEPPPLSDDRRLLGQILVESLPQAPPYELGGKARGPLFDPLIAANAGACGFSEQSLDLIPPCMIQAFDRPECWGAGPLLHLAVVAKGAFAPALDPEPDTPVRAVARQDS